MSRMLSSDGPGTLSGEIEARELPDGMPDEGPSQGIVEEIGEELREQLKSCRPTREDPISTRLLAAISMLPEEVLAREPADRWNRKE